MDSSSESSTGSNNGLQGSLQRSDKGFSTTHLRSILLISLHHLPTSQQQTSTSATLSPPTISTAKLPGSSTSIHPPTTDCATSSPTADSSDKFPGLSPTKPGTTISSPEIVSSQDPVHPSHSASSEPHSSNPSLSLPFNQWLTIQRQSGLNFAVRNQLSSLANHYVIPSNRSMRIKL